MVFIHRDRWPVDQAASLRRLAGRAVGQATSIAIVSGKGGVGKTSIAVNLAVELASKRLRVVLLDLDLGLANADLLLNLRVSRNLSHVLSGACTIEEALVSGPAGLQVVPSAAGVELMANLSEFQRHQLLLQLRGLSCGRDLLVMDLGAGVSRNVLEFARAADLVLVITTPEPTAIADAYASIKMILMGERASEIELLVNQANSKKDARLAYERIAAVAGRFLGFVVTFAGYVLTDDAVAAAVRSRQPFVLSAPRCNASACIRALARRYLKLVGAPQHQEGFFDRVAQMFL